MSKLFYFSLIFILTTIIDQIYEMYNFYTICKKEKAYFMFSIFWKLDIFSLIITIFIAALFFLYRFDEKIKWPIWSSIVDLIFISILWTMIYQYYFDPLKFLQVYSKKQWKKYQNSHELNQIIIDISKKYKCCGFDENNSKEICNENKISCTRAIIKNCRKNLSSHIKKLFNISFFHIAGILSIWITYFLGGIEYDQNINNYHREFNFKDK